MAPPWSQFGAIWVQDGPSRDPLGAPSHRQSPPKSLPLAQKLTGRPPRSPRMPPSTSFWKLFGHLCGHSEGFGVPVGVTSGEGGSRLGAKPSAGNFEDPLAIAPPAVPPRTSFFPRHRAELAIATWIAIAGRCPGGQLGILLGMCWIGLEWVGWSLGWVGFVLGRLGRVGWVG